MVVQLAQDTDITDVQYIDCTYTHNGPNYSHYLYMCINVYIYIYIYLCMYICFRCTLYIYMLVYLAYLCTLVSGHILRLIITLKTNYFVAFRDCPWLLLLLLLLLLLFCTGSVAFNMIIAFRVYRCCYFAPCALIFYWKAAASKKCKKTKKIPLFVLNFMHSYFANITQSVCTHI